ncbi:vacuolar-type H+-ATPase subunit I/STV1 [Deinococcus metallilatus]|uniref:Vacuolar-type H+-ATPase subunit I/STV1 n=1 Tax=Deinococcus metallilatus TaxID=1211322 RepID=A0ABR6MS42_9DEIO|nr:vacuolar-type H+-ATPase subunit I/STV1 [Deinococcus metallilatus]
MSESAEKREVLLAGAREAMSAPRRRLAEARAREHVGAAGWAQTRVLEDIIRAGREGLAATDTLRQVVCLTTEQVRALPLAAQPEEREGHARALAEIVQSGETQITAAEALDNLIRRALEDVTRTPLESVNVRALRQIRQRVREQMQALETIITSARAQADTLEETARLERLSAEHQERVNALRQLSAEEEVQALADAGADIVEHIAELDEAGAGQLDALARIGEAVAEKIRDTGAPLAEQVQALDELAQTVQQKAEELREG